MRVSKLLQYLAAVSLVGSIWVNFLVANSILLIIIWIIILAVSSIWHRNMVEKD